MSGDSFVHLHNHTEYSMLDGAAKLPEMFERCAELGMEAIAITDHGNMFGAFDFYAKACEAGIKPIIGLEAYLTPNTARYDRTRVRWADGGEDDVSGGGAYTHMTLLATSTPGMHNLFRAASRASLEGFFYKPRLDRDLLHSYHDGLIGTTGCPGGEVQTWLRIGDYPKALASAREFQDIFGKENFYVELMDHGIAVERRVRKDLLRIAKDIGAPLLATNDSHYVNQDDHRHHAALLCVQSQSTVDDPKRFKFEGDTYYMRSPAEMRKLFPAEAFPGACDNTLAIAERCEVTFDTSSSYMPRFPVPEGETEASWFVKEVERGLARRYPGGISDEVRERTDYEVDVIRGMNFPGYFLVVADFINWAKENGIRVGPGRGSGAGSMVAYAMRITDLDPLEHGLLFERFLNPDRVSMPDFDVDFDDRRRGDVIRYVTEKYGDDRVAQIVTYGTIKAKQAVKDAARVLGYPFSMGDRITKVMPPPVMGKEVPLKGLFDNSHERYKEGEEFRQLVNSDTEVQRVMDTARGLEGLKRQWGVHAAGVIMSSAPLLDLIPIMRREQDGAIITQFDYPTCERLGMIKMDFLGLRNLGILDDALVNITRNRGETIVLEELPLDDEATYELLGRGDTLGVFQLDGGPMRALLRSMRPSSFGDITAVIALYRPGPMGMNSHNEYADRKNDRKPVVPIHPELEEPLQEILGETYGLIVYQEQVMGLAQKVAGYTLGGADLLRRAMGKKKKKELDAQYEVFSTGMAERGYSPDTITTLWDALLPFADYGFNKSHGAAYALIAYWTAYLKAHYPAEFMAALLTSVADAKDKMALYLGECRAMAITVLPPDVNESENVFTPIGKQIRFGLSAIRNVGTGAVAGIIAARKDKQRYTDFADFLNKVDAVVCNKKTVESLIKAGAFDSLSHPRKGLLMCHADAVDGVMSVKRAEAAGQFDLFGHMDAADIGDVMSVAVPDTEWEPKVLLGFEREMLGLYVSSHPLAAYTGCLARQVDTSMTHVLDGTVADRSMVTVGGIITGLQRKMTKNGDPMATAMLEDLDGAVEVTFFPKAYAQCAMYLAEDAIVLVKGWVSRDNDRLQIKAHQVTVPELTADAKSGPLQLSVSAQRCTQPVVDRLKQVLSNHPGTTEVHLRLTNTGHDTTVRLDNQWRVTPSAALMGDLKALLGAECLV